MREKPETKIQLMIHHDFLLFTKKTKMMPKVDTHILVSGLGRDDGKNTSSRKYLYVSNEQPNIQSHTTKTKFDISGKKANME